MSATCASTSAILASWLEKQNNHPDDQHTTERRVFVSHLKLHHHVVEFVISPTANKLTDMVFTWNTEEAQSKPADTPESCLTEMMMIIV